MHFLDQAKIFVRSGAGGPGAVSFRATDPKLGEIGFVGAIDAKALAAAQDAGPGDSRVVMTGTLRVGEATFEDARFTYFMGD